MSQIVEAMNEQDAAHVEAKRDWVRNHYEPNALDQYETVEGKLKLIRAILDNGWILSSETAKLQCLGVTFGDALAQFMGLVWVVVEDEIGRDPALRLEGTSVLVFPGTVISKRIERGESVDVYELFRSACHTINSAAEQAR